MNPDYVINLMLSEDRLDDAANKAEVPTDALQLKRDYQKEYYLKNKESLREEQRLYTAKNSSKNVLRVKVWRENNKEKRGLSDRKRYNSDPAKVKKYLRDWVRKNPDKRNNYVKNWKNSGSEGALRVRLSGNLRRRLLHALKGSPKSKSSMRLIGCSTAELKLHLENRFSEGMSWDSYGKGSECWNVDHIKPCAHFDLRNPDEQSACFHYTNLQPLWELENTLKGCKLLTKI